MSDNKENQCGYLINLDLTRSPFLHKFKHKTQLRQNAHIPVPGLAYFQAKSKTVCENHPPASTFSTRAKYKITTEVSMK